MLPIVLYQSKLRTEKDKLRKLCQKEVMKMKKHEEANKDVWLNIPIVTSVDKLVAKRVQYLTSDYDGKEKWFQGVVVFQEPDSDTNLVICCDCEDTFYSLNFSDFENFGVKLASSTLINALDKLIRQRFTNIEEYDLCWEQIIVISQNLNSSSNFIGNFLIIMSMMRVKPH